jgi:branched-chain amino acid transport system ATP-binding protein
MASMAASSAHPKKLVVREISKVFVGLKALDRVSLELNQGEILGLIGPNGSGKTTLINIITGLLPSTSGEIWVNGTKITRSPPYVIARLGVTRTYQTIRLFKELTVSENVEVAAVGSGMHRLEAHRWADLLLHEMGLQAWLDYYADELPYGLERRVEITRALAMKPCFLMLDEPAAGLNEEESDELMDRLAPIPTKMNLGMLIVDHDMRLIMRLCHRLLVLNHGKTIGEGSPEVVRCIPDVIRAYLESTDSDSME